jgi:putative endonuclease
MLMLKKFVAWYKSFCNENVRRGWRGERIAARFLKKDGFHILDRNWRYGRYELDIVAEKQTCIVFVEVRSRTIKSLQSGFDSVGIKKKTAIKHAACAYRRSHPGIKSYRFDVISIDWTGDGKLQTINHYENITMP